jgi:hypothetical protein
MDRACQSADPTPAAPTPAASPRCVPALTRSSDDTPVPRLARAFAAGGPRLRQGRAGAWRALWDTLPPCVVRPRKCQRAGRTHTWMRDSLT